MVQVYLPPHIYNSVVNSIRDDINKLPLELSSVLSHYHKIQVESDIKSNHYVFGHTQQYRNSITRVLYKHGIEPLHAVLKFRVTGILGNSEVISSNDPPKWLLGGRMGSTMDNRWFYYGRVLTLGIGESVGTDFSKITRIE